MFFCNLLLDTNYELKNRFMHVDYVDSVYSQSSIPKVSKSQFDTLECTLEELAVLELISNLKVFELSPVKVRYSAPFVCYAQFFRVILYPVLPPKFIL